MMLSYVLVTLVRRPVSFQLPYGDRVRLHTG
jgi:hypothetical protein